MVIINKIEEPVSYLFLNDKLIGEINSCLQLNDCLLQIRKNGYSGYVLKYNGINYDISSTGRIVGGVSIYSLYSNQIKEIIGF